MLRSIACLSLWLYALSAPAIAGLLPISDEFNDPSTIDQWSRINQTEGWNADQLKVWDIDASQPGRMVMQPYAVTWYQNLRGPLAYKTLSGNFALTTQVVIRNGANQSVTPASDYSLGGVMLRRPTGVTDPATQWVAGNEDYVFLSLGFGNGGISNGPQYEIKTMNNSNSNLTLSPADSLTATLQLSRITTNVGTYVIALLLEPNSSWQVFGRFRRDDMGGTLQAGLVAYTDYSTVAAINPFAHNSSVMTPGNPLLGGNTPHPDLIAGFEYARYYDLGALPQALQNADLLNTSEVPNAMLLSLLAPASVPEPSSVVLAALAVATLALSPRARRAIAARGAARR